MEKRNKLLYLLKNSILILLFCAAVYFENAQQQRLYVLVIVFVTYLTIGFCRSSVNHESNFYYLSFILDIALVYILEYNSRLLINYFFHSFYIIILLESALSLGFKTGIKIGVVTVLVSLIKYAYLIYYKFNFSNVSQLAFFLMINILILVVVGFAQYNREERDRKDILYRELFDTHRQLKQYTDEVNRLTVVEERNRIARDIHDSLGHNMTALIMQLQMGQHLVQEDPVKAEKLLVNAVGTAKDSLSGIREVVETLRGVESIAPIQAIRRLVNEFAEKTGVDINCDIMGESATQNSSANIAVYRIVQEAMTNAIRHGKAERVLMKLCYSSTSIYFCISDNGVGSKAVNEGYGLKGIRERVEAFDGKVEFRTCNGFSIEGVLYLEGKNDKSIVG